MGFKNPTGSWAIITFNLHYISLPNHSFHSNCKPGGGWGHLRKAPGKQVCLRAAEPRTHAPAFWPHPPGPSHTLKITTRILIPLPLPCCWSLWCCFRLWRTQRHNHSLCLSRRCDLIAESTPVPQFSRIQLWWRQTRNNTGTYAGTLVHTHTHTHTHNDYLGVQGGQRQINWSRGWAYQEIMSWRGGGEGCFCGHWKIADGRMNKACCNICSLLCAQLFNVFKEQLWRIADYHSPSEQHFTRK